MNREADLQKLGLYQSQVQKTKSERVMKLLCIAKARQSLEVLREQQSLHENLAEVWEPDFRLPGKRGRHAPVRHA